MICYSEEYMQWSSIMSHHVILFNMPGTNFMTIKKNIFYFSIKCKGGLWQHGFGAAFYAV